MAKDENKRLNRKELNNDTVANDALKGIESYAPANPRCSVANLQILYTTMVAAQATETRADAALRAARDKAISAEWSFHNTILASKDQVKAQYGKDSNELQSIGLKKASEYKRPIHKKRLAVVK